MYLSVNQLRGKQMEELIPSITTSPQRANKPIASQMSVYLSLKTIQREMEMENEHTPSTNTTPLRAKNPIPSQISVFVCEHNSYGNGEGDR